MITEEQLTKTIKLVTQDAWKQGTHTTVNEMIEYIVRESLLNCVMPEIEHLYEEIEYLDEELHKYKNTEDAIQEYLPIKTTTEINPLRFKEPVYATENGRNEKPQRRAKAAL